MLRGKAWPGPRDTACFLYTKTGLNVAGHGPGMVEELEVEGESDRVPCLGGSPRRPLITNINIIITIHDVIAGAAKGGDRSADRVPVADPSGGALVPPRPQQRRRPEDPRHAQRRRVRYLTLPALKSLCCGSRGCREFRHTYLLILSWAISFGRQNRY